MESRAQAARAEWKLDGAGLASPLQLDHVRQRRFVRAAGRASVGALIVAATVGLSGCITPPHIPDHAAFELERALTNPEIPLHPDSRAGLEEATDEVCSDVGCVEAWTSTAADYFRFSETATADAFAAGSPDMFVDRYVVIQFAPAASRGTREDIVSTLLLHFPPEHAPWGF